MRQIFIILALVLSVRLYADDIQLRKQNNDTECVLDTVIIRSVNLTIPGRNDSIIYRLIVEKWEKPVKWYLSIISNKDTLFSMFRYDDRNDRFFNDPNYFDPCQLGYLVCKKVWYLERLINFRVSTIEIIDTTSRDFFYDQSKKIAEKIPNEYGNDITTSVNNWKTFWDYYRNRPLIIFRIFYAPEGGTSPLFAYHPFLKKLVPIYYH